MTIVIQKDSYELDDFLFRRVDSKAYNDSNAFAAEFLTQWISGKKEFELSTSGTTNNAKKIFLKRKWMEISALQTISILKLWDERVYCCIPIFKIGGLMMIVRALAGGFDITISEPVADPFLQLPMDHNFTFVSLVPYQFVQILKNPESKIKLDRFKVVLLGGAEVSQNMIKEIDTIIPDVFLTFGMTETCSHFALKKLNHKPWLHFVPNPGIEITVDELGQLSVIGLQTGGIKVNTTDMIKLYEDGSFDFLGRSDFVINSGGFKIFPETLEQKISEILFKNNLTISIALTSKPHPEWGEELVLLIENEPTINEHNLLKLLRPNLEKQELPKSIIKVSEVPLTAGGKPDRKKMKELVL